MFIEKTDIVLNSLHRRKPISIDARWVYDGKKHPVVLFIHGFKGFKDWGTFNLIANYFASSGFAFIKMNLSHNGTTLKKPTEFADLESFSLNNFSIELDDIQLVIDHLFGQHCLIPHLDLDRVYLAGHSRGGGLAILKASEDNRIQKCAAWAPIVSVEHLFRAIDLESWKEEGVYFIENARTQQQMPVKWQIMEDYFLHEERLNVLEAAKKLSHLLLVYATEDLAIPFADARLFASQLPSASTMVIAGAEHTFGGSEPFTDVDLPLFTWRMIERTIGFFQA